jgi:hypothetical protein
MVSLAKKRSRDEAYSCVTPCSTEQNDEKSGRSSKGMLLDHKDVGFKVSTLYSSGI